MRHSLFLDRIKNANDADTQTFCFYKTDKTRCPDVDIYLDPSSYQSWQEKIDFYKDHLVIYYADDATDASGKPIFLDTSKASMYDIDLQLIKSTKLGDVTPQISLQTSMVKSFRNILKLNSLKLYLDSPNLVANKLQLYGVVLASKDYKLSTSTLYIDDISVKSFGNSIDASFTYLNMANPPDAQIKFVRETNSIVYLQNIPSDGSISFSFDEIQVDTYSKVTSFKFANINTSVDFSFAESVKKIDIINVAQNQSTLFAHASFHSRSDLVFNIPYSLGASKIGPAVYADNGYNLNVETNVAELHLNTAFPDINAEGKISGAPNRSIVIPSIPILPKTTITGKSIMTGELVGSPYDAVVDSSVSDLYADLMTPKGGKLTLQGSTVYRIKHIMGGTSHVEFNNLGYLDACGTIRSTIKFNKLENPIIKYHLRNDYLDQGEYHVIQGAGIDCEKSKFTTDLKPGTKFNAQLQCSNTDGLKVTVTRITKSKFCISKDTKFCPAGYIVLQTEEEVASIGGLMDSPYAKLLVNHMKFDVILDITRDYLVHFDIIAYDTIFLSDNSMMTPLDIRMVGGSLNYKNGTMLTCNIVKLDYTGSVILSNMMLMEVNSTEQTWILPVKNLNRIEYVEGRNYICKISGKFNVDAGLDYYPLFLAESGTDILSQVVINVTGTGYFSFYGPDVNFTGFETVSLKLLKPSIKRDFTPKHFNVIYNCNDIPAIKTSEGSNIVFSFGSDLANIDTLTISPDVKITIEGEYNVTVNSLIIDNYANFYLPRRINVKRLASRVASTVSLCGASVTGEVVADILPASMPRIISRCGQINVDSVSFAISIDKFDNPPHKYLKIPGLPVIYGKVNYKSSKVNAVNPYYNTPEGQLYVVNRRNIVYVDHDNTPSPTEAPTASPTSSPFTESPTPFTRTPIPVTQTPDEAANRKKDIIFSVSFGFAGIVVAAIVCGIIIYCVKKKPVLDSPNLLSTDQL